ncbi:MAG: hypothetical protein KDA50_07110 [Rhodobacteraceae bacterium]|nr:hypothetical protein [Paracoccaceae bacterium]
MPGIQKRESAVDPAAAPVPIDRSFYAEQSGIADDAEAHYTRTGWRSGYDPTRFFLTRWYAWQNPDWDRAHPHPYAHYLDLGCAQNRDPSPFVDMTRYAQVAGSSDGAAAYRAILAGQRSPALGVYDGVADLQTQQDRFRAAIRVTAVRPRLSAPPRRNLVVLQKGTGTSHAHWDGAARDWDLLVNYFDACDCDPTFGDLVFAQKGTKFTAMAALWQLHGELFLPYDNVLFLDDDIDVGADDLNRFFDRATLLGLDLAQMSLSADSHCIWPSLFHDPASPGHRLVNAVEIMMPMLSRRALGLLAPSFRESVSGFGLDLLWGKTIAAAGGRAAIIDAVQAAHRKPIDDGQGAYYAYLRANMINPKAELWHLIQTHALDWHVGG